VFFQADYDKIVLQKIVNDVISMMFSPLRYQNNVTIFFPIWTPPNQNFCLRQCFWDSLIIIEITYHHLQRSLHRWVIWRGITKNYKMARSSRESFCYTSREITKKTNTVLKLCQAMRNRLFWEQTLLIVVWTLRLCSSWMKS